MCIPDTFLQLVFDVFVLRVYLLLEFFQGRRGIFTRRGAGRLGSGYTIVVPHFKIIFNLLARLQVYGTEVPVVEKLIGIELTGYRQLNHHRLTLGAGFSC